MLKVQTHLLLIVHHLPAGDEYIKLYINNKTSIHCNMLHISGVLMQTV